MRQLKFNTSFTKMDFHLMVILFMSFIVTSCFKEDDLIVPHQVGDLNESTIEMGQYYTTQAYFDLGTAQMVSKNSKDLWDLAFACDDSLLEIRLNAAKFARIAPIDDTAFYSIQDTSSLKWYYDVASGNSDSLAIHNWLDINGMDTIFTQNTFIIDKGFSALGTPQGLKKFKILSYRSNHYRIAFSNLDNSDWQIADVEKKSGVNFVQLALNSSADIYNLEPPKSEWDLLFSQYTDVLTTSDGEDYPYLVTGVLLNPYFTAAALDTNLNFENIQLADTILFDFKSNANVIGYKWKWYDFDAGLYLVLSNNNYIIRDQQNYYYKLRFIGFYNNVGQKGYPKFEFQKL